MNAVVAPAGIAMPFGMHPAAPVALFPGVDGDGSGDGGEVDETADGVAEVVGDAPVVAVVVGASVDSPEPVGAQPVRAMPTASVSRRNVDFDMWGTPNLLSNAHGLHADRTG